MKPIQHLGFGFLGHHTSQEMVELVQSAEALGFESAWVAEDYFYAGAFATASACAANTQTIRIGIGVINPYTRHPVLSAMEAAALDAVSEGRAVLAMGASNRRWMETDLGIPYNKPLTATREAVQIIKQLLRDGRLEFQGNVFRTGPISLDFTPFRRNLPVYMGVRGDRALYQAGQVADGVLLSVGCTLGYIRHARKLMEEGARSVGRDPSQVHLAAYLTVCAMEDSRAAVERMRPVARHYLEMHGNHPILTCGGFTAEEVEPFHAASAEGRTCTLPVTDEMVHRVVIAGTPQECRAQVQAFVDAGVEMPICFELGDESSPLETLQMLSDALLK